jgi:glycosyltransferase involved in cell wall biosynthesis
MRVLFATPTFWPAVAFGGPIRMASELTRGLRDRGHEVCVVTTSLRSVDEPPEHRFRSRTVQVDGIPVTYLATPLRYRWMGITPSLPLALTRYGRPDVVHIFGFRDFVTTCASLWADARGVPRVFEPLGMFEPRLRKVALKRALDASVYRMVWSHAEVVIATSAHERHQIAAAGPPVSRIEIRGNGFPDPQTVPIRGELRRRLGLTDEPIALYVGRLAAGKGIEFLLDAARQLERLHVVLVGPDDGHGVLEQVERARMDTNRVHALGPVDDPLPLYGDADVFVLASSGESFGMAAAEAAAAGTPVVVSDRCGIAEVLGDGAVVVPCEAVAVRDAVERVISDRLLRERLSAGALEAARSHSWPVMVARQEEIYGLAIERHD